MIKSSARKHPPANSKPWTVIWGSSEIKASQTKTRTTAAARSPNRNRRSLFRPFECASNSATAALAQDSQIYRFGSGPCISGPSLGTVLQKLHFAETLFASVVFGDSYGFGVDSGDW